MRSLPKLEYASPYTGATLVVRDDPDDDDLWLEIDEGKGDPIGLFLSPELVRFLVHQLVDYLAREGVGD